VRLVALTDHVFLLPALSQGGDDSSSEKVVSIKSDALSSLDKQLQVRTATQ
jgi:hypothetical protein